jgi:hypothetical protein
MTLRIIGRVDFRKIMFWKLFPFSGDEESYSVGCTRRSSSVTDLIGGTSNQDSTCEIITAVFMES